MRPVRLDPLEARALIADARRRGVKVIETRPAGLGLFGKPAVLKRVPTGLRILSKKARKRVDSWPALRAAVLARDGHTCLLCGATKAYSLTAHHVIFRSQQPDPQKADSETNLVTLCQGPYRNGCHLYRAHGENKRTGEATKTRWALLRKLAAMYGVAVRRLSQDGDPPEWAEFVNESAGRVQHGTYTSEEGALIGGLGRVRWLLDTGDRKSLMARA